MKLHFESNIDVSGAKVALEDAETVRIKLDGDKIQSAVDGWWAEGVIEIGKLPSRLRGKPRHLMRQG